MINILVTLRGCSDGRIWSARQTQEAANFGRPDRADGERLAHAQAMLHIMRDKARAGFGGGRALATDGLNLKRAADLALAKRARKLALGLKALDLKAPSVSVLLDHTWDIGCELS